MTHFLRQSVGKKINDPNPHLPFVKLSRQFSCDLAILKKIIFTVENNLFSHRFREFNVGRSEAAQREQGVAATAAEWGVSTAPSAGLHSAVAQVGLIDESQTQTEL